MYNLLTPYIYIYIYRDPKKEGRNIGRRQSLSIRVSSIWTSLLELSRRPVDLPFRDVRLVITSKLYPWWWNASSCRISTPVDSSFLSFLSFFFFFLFLSSSKSTLDFKRRNARRENEQKGEFSWASASHTNPLLHATPFNYVTLISRMHVTWIARFHERLRLLVHFSIFLSSMNPIFRIWGKKSLLEIY